MSLMICPLDVKRIVRLLKDAGLYNGDGVIHPVWLGGLIMWNCHVWSRPSGKSTVAAQDMYGAAPRDVVIEDAAARTERIYNAYLHDLTNSTSGPLDPEASLLAEAAASWAHDVAGSSEDERANLQYLSKVSALLK